MNSTLMAAIIIITLSSFIIAKILKKFAKKASPYLLFAIADILIGLLILGFAIYDFNTAEGEFAACSLKWTFRGTNWSKPSKP